MRIISGKFKGKKIILPKDKLTRPLKDLTKESIFNIINHSHEIKIEIDKSNILDLFSGTGSFGLECLSRGAKNVIFIENYKNILPILKKNINNLRFEKNSKIFEKDIFDENSLKFLDLKFDIIFLDPPFKEQKLFELVEKIVKNKILKKNGILIIHRHKKNQDILPKKLKILQEKTYGVSKIIFSNII